MNTAKIRIEKLMAFVLCFAMLLSMGTVSFAEGAACEHNNYAESITTAATCTVDGVKTFTCIEAECGAVWTEAITSPGHNYVEGVCDACGDSESLPLPELCTGDESCTAVGDDVVHSGSCPKSVVVLGECTGAADCGAAAHAADCLSYCSGDADCTATKHVDGCLSTVCTCTDKCSANTEACPVCDESTDLPNDCKGKKLPVADVIPQGGLTLSAGGYTVYNPFGSSNDSSSIARPLQVCVQFLATETGTEAAQNGYGNWLTDFYLSFGGLKSGSFIADGCYLAGYYGDFGWWVIPVDGQEVSQGVSIPVMGSVVGQWSYEDICSSVKDFKAAIYIDPAILAANPDLTVNLSLKISDPNSSDTYTCDSRSYSAAGLMNAEARIDNTEGAKLYASLADAAADAKSGDVITLLDDVSLDTAVTISAGSLIPGEHSITGTVNSALVLKSGDDVYGYYADLSTAITDANALSGEVTVEVYDKVEYTAATPNLGSSYSKISFVGKDSDAEICLTRNGSDGFISGTGSAPAVAFSNLTLSKSAGSYAGDAGFMNCCFTVYRVSSVSYSGCAFPNGACAAGCPTSYSGCTIGKSYEKYGLWVYGNTTATVDGCTFTGDRGVKLYAEGYAKTSNLVLSNSDLSGCTGKPAIVLTYAGSVTLSGNTYPSTGVFELDKDGSPNGTPVSADIDDIACMNDDYADCGVLMDGKIYIDLEAAVAAEGEGNAITLFYSPDKDISISEEVVIEDNGNAPSGTVTLASASASLAAVEGLDVVSGVSGYSVVYRNGVYSLVCYVAETGGVQYESLAAAIEAADDGGTVKLLRDNSENVDVDKNITLDTNGKEYTGAVSVASGNTLTISKENLASLSTGLKTDASDGKVSVGGKLIGLTDGTISVSGDGLSVVTEDTAYSYVGYNGMLIGVPAGDSLAIAADGSVSVPAGGSVVFAYNFEVPVDKASTLGADGVLLLYPDEVENYGYGRVCITYGEIKSDTVFVPAGASLSVSADASGKPVFTSDADEKPIVSTGNVAKPKLTVSPSRKAFYKYGLGTVTFTCNGFSSTLTGVSVDNVALNDNAFTVKAGSTVVTLKNAYLKTLSIGTHKLKLSYADGQTITATISVVETPVTGDNNQLAGFAYLMTGFAGSALALLYILKKRRA